MSLVPAKAMVSATGATVAAIVPVYNNMHTIIDAISSIESQSRRVDEVVVVDDGSTDGSDELVERTYGDLVRVLRQPNQGPSASRNTGIRNVRSELIAFLDADDRWLPTRIEKQAAYMEAHPSCMLSFGAHQIWHESTGKTNVENLEIDTRDFVRRSFFPEKLHIATDTVMVRRAVFQEVGYFDESLRQCEDTDMWLRIMCRFGFAHISEPLAWVRRSATYCEPRAGKANADFEWNKKYFAKHRYAFGHGLGAYRVWCTAYAAVLLRQARLLLNARDRLGAARHLVHSKCLHPLGQPRSTTRCAARIVLGDRLFSALCRRMFRSA